MEEALEVDRAETNARGNRVEERGGDRFVWSVEIGDCAVQGASHSHSPSAEALMHEIPD